ncbi:hypothetical protein BU24DRAFT_418582 [Aaosphaeria arxii CBS 175.79]|uniref:RING-type domain-containing protein n=1 Tax=Aaosphaeria arxii CBS 175.79 TaxID=1450172 RepID=A0A6A5Y1Q8_9PLEO|nr:uncharacterized protein BU24DRAFT_418582 [Aaosphaeria arxii CBS 175.79]KAF2018997.1 hypothetical protein BU24DRAFT_418582 [Aaosphaeria arxii CBS 175.79]
MEFVLRCNDLNCRAQLHDRAVVTTCSHVFCSPCADGSGLSRTASANRQCPACGTHLSNPDDVVFTALNPSEDYKTSILSGLAPSVIFECASRGLQFHSYQTSQEIIYQEHLAKNLTDNYANLNQQMDQLIHDANAQIKLLQDKLVAMQAEQSSLEDKNHELIKAYREKNQSLQQVQKLYQSLKAQVMASHVAHAAGDEANFAVRSARGDRFISKIPGARISTEDGNRSGVENQRNGGAMHIRSRSGSSGNGGQQGRGGGIGLSPAWKPNSHIGLGNRAGTGGNPAVDFNSPQSLSRSRLPVLGGTRANALLASDGPYNASPGTRNILTGSARNLGTFGFGLKAPKRASGTSGR